MITEGSSALKLPLNSVQEEMEKYLSAEGGYWARNDIWRTDSEAYRAGGLRESRRDGVLADFTECRNANMKLELKYFILFSTAAVEKPGLCAGYAGIRNPPGWKACRFFWYL